jgi:hypothetical protein
MSEWNFDMEQAPRGRYVSRTIMTPKGPKVREQYEHDPIIATDGTMVTVSRWLPPITEGPESHRRQGRWGMFGVNETPLAWMPWPKPPGHGGVK